MLELAMQTVPEIDFQGMPGTPRIQAAIEKHISEIEFERAVRHERYIADQKSEPFSPFGFGS
jgi:hypothetical protein